MSGSRAPDAWRLAAGCVAGVAIVASLVVWRTLHTEGGWLLAVRLTGGVAVFGLIVAIWLALRPTDASRELVLRVSEGGSGPVTETVATTAPAGGTGQRTALLVALAAVLPALLAVVLAVPAPAGAESTTEPTTEPTSSTSTSTEPEPTEPTEPAPTEAEPTEPEPTEPAPTEPEAPAETGGASYCPAGPPQPYQVVSGDSLWVIAERSLLGSGDNAEIDALWRQIYDANRDVLGPDPDLIFPGQQILACR